VSVCCCSTLAAGFFFLARENLWLVYLQPITNHRFSLRILQPEKKTLIGSGEVRWDFCFWEWNSGHDHSVLG
jgi:hypothetical protein